MTVKNLRVFSSPRPIADIVAVLAGTLFFSPSGRGCRHDTAERLGSRAKNRHSECLFLFYSAYFYSTRVPPAILILQRPIEETYEEPRTGVSG